MAWSACSVQHSPCWWRSRRASTPTSSSALSPTSPRHPRWRHWSGSTRVREQVHGTATAGMPLRWLGPGLFLATLATLLVETLNARLLSVLTWYHLSFFAVSLAMLGMAGGAVHVFLRPDKYGPARAPQALARVTLAFALSIPLSHLVTLVVPFTPVERLSVMDVLPVAVFTVVLAVPFVLSGVLVTIALTRVGAPIGRIYAWDLVGAALGCLLVVVLLERLNLTLAFFVAGAAAALGAWSFHRAAGEPRAWRPMAAAVVLAAAALANAGPTGLFQIIYPKNRQLWLQHGANAIARWNSHSYVTVHRPGETRAFMWGPAEGAERFRTTTAWLVIDGEAGSPITQWDGRRESLDWVSYDVTTLPYFIRQDGRVAIVGVGGGRDVLSAIWAGSRSIVGIEVNRIILDLHEGSHRTFANIATQPHVRLVHDDGRAWLTRTDERFDVIQISLVDTWASTGAGAVALSENGLYTLDAWRVFLDRLTPGGVLSVSRWFDPANVSETSRLVALGIAALIDRGVERPADHLVLAVRERVATLMISTAPFTADDRRRLEEAEANRGYQLAVSPWAPAAAGPVVDRIASSRTRAGSTTAGRLAAPGRPPLPAGCFALSMSYFAITGFAFMLVQIAFLQRFAIYLGHPTYTLSTVLFSMLVAAGAGSLLSERLPVGGRGRYLLVPVLIAAALAVTAVALPRVMDTTITAGLAARSIIVLAIIGPGALLFGLCFPTGARLIAGTPALTAWAWGINGAFGVLASILAVGLSIWVGIDANFWIAAGLYFLLLPLMPAMGSDAPGRDDHRA